MIILKHSDANKPTVTLWSWPIGGKYPQKLEILVITISKIDIFENQKNQVLCWFNFFEVNHGNFCNVFSQSKISTDEQPTYLRLSHTRGYKFHLSITTYKNSHSNLTTLENLTYNNRSVCTVKTLKKFGI